MCSESFGSAVQRVAIPPADQVSYDDATFFFHEVRTLVSQSLRADQVSSDSGVTNGQILIAATESQSLPADQVRSDLLWAAVMSFLVADVAIPPCRSGQFRPRS
jgi:hypothetical protein